MPETALACARAGEAKGDGHSPCHVSGRCCPVPTGGMLTPVAEEDLIVVGAQALAFGASTLEGAGQGCFTLGSLAEGETVARDTAVLCAHSRGSFSSLLWALTDEALKTGEHRFWCSSEPLIVRDLQRRCGWGAVDEAQAQDLCDAYNVSYATVVRAYAFLSAVSLQHTSGALGFHTLLCHLNNACVPNCCVVDADDSQSTKLLVALRCIAAGEELTVSYAPAETGAARTAAARRELLLTRFGFVCRCPTCTWEMDMPVLST